jgi:hypothetical protein
MNCSRPTLIGCYAHTLNLWFFSENLVDLFEQFVIVRLGDNLVIRLIVQDEYIIVGIVLHAGNK